MALVPESICEDWQALSQGQVAVSLDLWMLLENEWNPVIKDFRRVLGRSPLSIEGTEQLLVLLKALRVVLNKIIPTYNSNTQEWSGGSNLPAVVTRLISHHIGNDLSPVSMDTESLGHVRNTHIL